MTRNRRCLRPLRQTHHENKTSVRFGSSGSHSRIGQLRPSRSFHQLPSWVARASHHRPALRRGGRPAMPAARAGHGLQTRAALRTGRRISSGRSVPPGRVCRPALRLSRSPQLRPWPQWSGRSGLWPWRSQLGPGRTPVNAAPLVPPGGPKGLPGFFVADGPPPGATQRQVWKGNPTPRRVVPSHCLSCWCSPYSI